MVSDSYISFCWPDLLEGVLSRFLIEFILKWLAALPFYGLTYCFGEPDGDPFFRSYEIYDGYVVSQNFVRDPVLPSLF